jgi:hypothetical protein
MRQAAEATMAAEEAVLMAVVVAEVITADSYQ